MKMQIYADKNGNRVEVRQDGELPAQVEFAPQGGGFVRRVPRELFIARFKPFDGPPPFRRAKFMLADEFTCTGFTDSSRWNGWAMPYLPFEQAQRVLTMQGGYLRYDAAQDAFSTGSGEEEEVYPATFITVDGQKEKAYPIGAGSWCWDLIPD